MGVTGAPAGVADPVLSSFTEAVGLEGPVCVVGGRTQWTLGGLPAPGTREVTAPAGVVSHQPDEMIVRVRAGTTVADLSAALLRSGQMVPLDPSTPDRATVGGVLAAGQSGCRRLRYGPVRDTLLEARFVSAEGRLLKAGGPVVKNVTGYDLCRLLVGSLGTLGLLAEVVLRCQPVPAVSAWYRVADADPFDLARRLYRPSSVLWDGTEVWVLLEGHPDDVAGQATVVLGGTVPESCAALPAGGGWSNRDGGPARGDVPFEPARLSLTAAQLRRLPPGGGWWAEIGVGTVHAGHPAEVAAAVGAVWPPPPAPAVAALNREVKARFDPTGRLNPGRQVP
jgi:glycolate oxidase FAD binding subunit